MVFSFFLGVRNATLCYFKGLVFALVKNKKIINRHIFLKLSKTASLPGFFPPFVLLGCHFFCFGVGHVVLSVLYFGLLVV